MLSSIFHRRVMALSLLVSSVITFTPFSPAQAVAVTAVKSPFVYTFNNDGTLVEAGSMSEASSGYWWLNAGGKLPIQNGVGSTIQGNLSQLDPWRTLYSIANPKDTDNGAHPQNLFRLVSRSTWGNAHVESLFKINKDNFSTSPNRNSSNGLLLMQRYHTGGQTLYYAGLRVDGTAVIKKKINGTYFTMAQKTVFPGTYVSGGSVNLIPHNVWLKISAETVNNADNSVTIRLYLQKPGETVSTKILEVKDSGQFGGTPPIQENGYVGIRTDFMDVSFDNFIAENI